MAFGRRAHEFGLAAAAAMLMLGAHGVPALEAISPPSGRAPTVHLGPRLLDPAEHQIGKQIPDTPFTGVDGRAHRLFDDAGRRGTVVIVRDPACPVSQRYGPRIKQLAERYGDDFSFVYIYPSTDLTAEERADDARAIGLPGQFAVRGSFVLAEVLGVASTGDVFVLDDARRLRYRGAVDDQFGVGYTRDFPTAHYLRNALDDVRSGRPVDTPATSAPGCYIDADPLKDRLIPSVPGGHLLS
ncbi:MAG: hypothetical protein QNJ91_01890 [Gammaproteobacteria bacterium]|nr:hypothetical protein [Gammaproteobacteria bacterium]